MYLREEHDHDTGDARIIELTAAANLKQAVVERPDRSLKEVFSEVLVSTVANLEADGAIGVSLPTLESIRPSLHRERAALRPNLPNSLEEVETELCAARGLSRRAEVLRPPPGAEVLVLTRRCAAAGKFSQRPAATNDR